MGHYQDSKWLKEPIVCTLSFLIDSFFIKAARHFRTQKVKKIAKSFNAAQVGVMNNGPENLNNSITFEVETKFVTCSKLLLKFCIREK